MTSSLKFRGASSSSSSAHQWTYGVYLSFRVEDTRKNLTGHLYDALERIGIKTFIDDEQLRSGEEIPSELLKAIEESRISVVVLSENYASSAWCLEELTKISECREKKGQMVLPVLYHVDRSDVRNLRGTFGESFGKLEKRFRDNPEKIKRWKAVLVEVSNLSGWQVSHDRDEATFIRNFVQGIERIISLQTDVAEKTRHTDFQVAKHPDGIKSPDRPKGEVSARIKKLFDERKEDKLAEGLPRVQWRPVYSSFSDPIGIGSPGQLPQSSFSSIDGIESPVQVLNLSSSPSVNGEQGSNSFLSRHGIILLLIGSMIGLLQMNDLFKTHPANMWISEAALVLFCLSYAAMANIDGTPWEKYFKIIDIFRILTGTLVAVSLSSINLPHQLSWLFYAIWAFMGFIMVAFRWIFPEEEGREAETIIPPVPV